MFSLPEPKPVRLKTPVKDGRQLTALAYRRAQRRDTALIYLHGIESHASWFDRAGRLLARRGYDVYALDRRGSGLNRENEGFISGHVDTYRTLLADLDPLVTSLRRKYQNVHLVGLSWGGKYAVGYALATAKVDGLILITPGLKARIQPPLAKKLAIFLCSYLAPTAQFTTGIEPEMFTTTPLYLRQIRMDPLRLRTASARFLVQSNALERDIERNLSENRLPILVLLAGRDQIIDNTAVTTLLHRSAVKPDIIIYEDQTHSIQFDAPEWMVRDIVHWLKARHQHEN